MRSKKNKINTKNIKKKNMIFTVLGILIFLVGAGFVAYPYIGGFFVGRTQQEIVTKIEEVIAQAREANSAQETPQTVHSNTANVEGSPVPENLINSEIFNNHENSETPEISENPESSQYSEGSPSPERTEEGGVVNYSFGEDAPVAEESSGFEFDAKTGYITWTVDAAPKSEEDDVDQWFDPTTGEKLDTTQGEAELIPGSTLPPSGKRVLVLRGMLRVDKVGVYLPIVDGTGATELRYAVGRWRSGVMFGEEGNCIIAGHRNYTFGDFFNRLNEMEIGDEMIITDLDGNTYTYIVDNVMIIDPGDKSATESEPGEKRLTLWTCHPLYVGTHRLLVQGLLLDDDESAEGEAGGY